MVARILSVIVVIISLNSVTLGAIISADHPSFGVGSLTRDLAQGLDFLDMTESINRSYNDVASEFGSDGDFEGFRFATEEEVVSLVNNWGFSPGAIAGTSVSGDAGIDQLSGLFDLIGATHTRDDARLANGFTSTPAGPEEQRAFVLLDVFDHSTGPLTSDVAAGTKSFPVTWSHPQMGSFLVQPSSVVPEPGAITLLGIGAVVLGIGRLRTRRKQALLSPDHPTEK